MLLVLSHYVLLVEFARPKEASSRARPPYRQRSRSGAAFLHHEREIRTTDRRTAGVSEIPNDFSKTHDETQDAAQGIRTRFRPQDTNFVHNREVAVTHL